MVKAAAGISDDDPSTRRSRSSASAARRRRSRTCSASPPGCSRRSRASEPAGDRLGGARGQEQHRGRPAARPPLRGHPLGGGAAARPDRAPRRLGARTAPRSSASPARSCSTRGPGGAEAASARRRSSSSRCPRGERGARREAASPARGRSGEVPPPSRGVLERPRAIRSSSRRRSGCSSRAARQRGADRVPDTLQALIAARIDHLPPAAKTLLQRASVIGRVFWTGALEHLVARHRGDRALLDDLLLREFLLREPRSSISGEPAYRFKHLLIREVAYAGLTKPRGRSITSVRGVARGADGRGAARDSRVPPRPGGRVPHRARRRAARGARGRDRGRARKAAKRAIAREANVTARSSGCARSSSGRRSAPLPRGARGLEAQDLAAVQVEMEKVRTRRASGRARHRGARAEALGEACAQARRRPERSADLVEEALELLADRTTRRALRRARPSARRSGLAGRDEGSSATWSRRTRSPSTPAEGSADDRSTGARADAHCGSSWTRRSFW